MEQEIEKNQKPALSVAISRAIAGHCPNCGKGQLLRSYLKPVERCEVCGEPFGHIRADDGPAWLTILIVGHIVVTLMLAIVPESSWPDWVSMIVWPALSLAMALLMLPRAKGLFIAVMWHTGAGLHR